MRQAPTGTVTFLFTDIEGSTRMWEEQPDVMSPDLARHDELLREVIEANGGHVFKTTGDGTLAAFADADAAVRAASAAQRAVSEALPLKIRVALHTGVAEQRDGDYFGPTLNRAARLLGVAHGGQVVVSQATATLVPDAELRDLGEHRLRDLSRAERVHQLMGSGLPVDFPPLRSLDAYSGNLPLQLTSFVGRESESKALADAFVTARLVTIVGVGGVGKTRVAMQVAAEVVTAVREGAWVCELATAGDAETVAQVVGGALGVTIQPGTTTELSIVEFLRTKQVLLVLDNCEHVLDAAGALADAVLHACGGVRILATSREPLAIDGEHIFALRSLPVGSDAEGLDALVASDAVRLFADRAHAKRDDFSIDASNAAAVGEICRRLDGIPLAIELAAARVVAMNAGEIASLLDERFRLLTGGRRGSLERHQTLRATVEWSYALLEPAERTVFDRLAVFSGFDATAARAVVTSDDLDGWAVTDALEGLVRKSMLLAEDPTGGNTRYQMLETLRQYAREQLDARGELDTWRRRHAEYFADLAEAIGPLLMGPDEIATRPRLSADLDNLRAASVWALDTDEPGDAELGVRILAALAEDYGIVSSSRLALPSPARAVEWARRSTPGRRAAVLAGAAYEAIQDFDIDSARALAFEALGDGITPDCPTPYRVLFVVASDGQSSHIDSMPIVEAALGAMAEAGVPLSEQARVYGILVQAAVRDGDFDRARAAAERADELAQRSGNPSTIAQISYHVGTLWARDDPERALAAYERSIELARAGANDIQLAAALFQASLLRARGGEQARAIRDLRDAVAFLEWTKETRTLEGALAYAIEVLTVLGDYEEAAVIAGAARSGSLQRVRKMDMPPERRQRNTSPLREALGDRFDEHAARGAAMSFDELVAWTRTTLTALLEAAEAQKQPEDRGSNP